MNCLEKFKGIPYCFWKPGFDEPIYKINKLPSLECLKKQGTCCSGLLNLLMISLSKKKISWRNRRLVFTPYNFRLK